MFANFITPAACRSYRPPHRRICRRSHIILVHHARERGRTVRSAEEFEAVQRLMAIGMNDCSIARQTGIPRRTVWDWRYCRSLIRARGPSAASACGIDHDFSALPTAPNGYLLGLYLGDGCISRSGRVWRLRIVLDAKYRRLSRAAARRSTPSCRGSARRRYVVLIIASRSRCTRNTGRVSCLSMVPVRSTMRTAGVGDGGEPTVDFIAPTRPTN
jgi:hypothetical protein